MFEGFDPRCRTLGQHFDATIVEVPHVTNDLMARRGALRKEPVPDSLHTATDEKLTSNWKFIHTNEFNTHVDIMQTRRR